MIRSWLFRSFVLVMLAACSESTGPVATTESPRSPTEALPMFCEAGCLEEDPNPSAPGIYIAGEAYTKSGCIEFGSDADYDGLSDECEHQLALHFAPFLSFVYGDDVRRDPKYAAHWEAIDTVRVAYLLSYWMDNGSPGAPLCIPQFEGCAGHLGDSEAIVLDLIYDTSSHHWQVARALLSVHGLNYFCVKQSHSFPCQSGSHLYPSGNLQFASHPQAAPLIMVADGKHANYPTDAACDAGGHYSADDCSTPRYVDVAMVTQSNNIGSRNHQWIDGATTSNNTHPSYSSQYVEYYWTSQAFRGWFNPSLGTTSRPYTDILADYGF